MAAIDHLYRYACPSSLAPSDDGYHLQFTAELTSRTETGFFRGTLLQPFVTAQCLRTVSDLVGTRFYTPPSMLARIRREADPVVTVANDQLRFEGFSACCSTYIRHDMSGPSFAVEQQRSGTTNVDFQGGMRAALAKIRAETPVTLVVNKDAVELHQPAQSVIERKVPLPVRWIKGFAEVQSHLASMEPKFSLSRVQTQRLLRSLPRTQADHEQWLVPSAQGARLSTRKSSGGVMVKGTQRLRLFEKLAPYAEKLDLWFSETQSSSAWVLDFGTQRLMLVLNSEPWRGFSGDGSLLSQLATTDQSAVAAVKAQLSWQGSIDPIQVAQTTEQPRAAVVKALDILAAQGLLGFDLVTGTYFHRVLPFDLSAIEKLNPRLKSASALVAAGAVTLVQEGDKLVAEISSDGVTHQVLIGADQSSCTCPWYSKNNSSRGPCKHILAAEMTLDASA